VLVDREIDTAARPKEFLGDLRAEGALSRRPARPGWKLVLSLEVPLRHWRTEGPASVPSADVAQFVHQPSNDLLTAEVIC